MTKTVRIAVHATPGASRNHVGGQHDGVLRIAVTAVADKGKANQAIAQLIAKAIGVARADVQLVRGPTNRRKVFDISNPPNGIEDRVAELMKDPS